MVEHAAAGRRSLIAGIGQARKTIVDVLSDGPVHEDHVHRRGCLQVALRDLIE